MIDWFFALFQPLVFTKLILAVLLFLFAIFLFVIITQINRMNAVVAQGTSSVILLILASILFAGTIFLLIFTVIVV